MTDIRDAIEKITANVVAKPRVARDPVNEPTIRNWAEALGAVSYTHLTLPTTPYV